MSGDQAGHSMARVALPRECQANVWRKAGECLAKGWRKAGARLGPGAARENHAPGGIRTRALRIKRVLSLTLSLYYAAVSDDGQAEESSIYSVACSTVSPTHVRTPIAHP